MYTTPLILTAAAAAMFSITDCTAMSSFKNDNGSWVHVTDSWDAFDKAFDDFDSKFSGISKSLDAKVAAAEAKARKAEKKAMQTMERLQQKHGSNSTTSNSTVGGNTFVGGSHNVILDSSSPDKPDMIINGKALDVSDGDSVKTNNTGTFVIKSDTEGKACLSAVGIIEVI